MNLLQEINDTLTALLEERGLDARTLHTHVTSLPPDGSVVEVEVSDPNLAEELPLRLGLDAERRRQLRVVVLPRGGLPEGFIAASSVADVRRHPSHPSELVTQVVYGDLVVPLKQEGDWFLCRIDDGYLGWIRSWHLVESSRAGQAEFMRRSGHRVGVNHSEALAEPDPRSLPVTDLVIGTPLVVEPGGRRGWAAVELADGKRGFVRRPHVEKRPRQGTIARAKLVATGLRFLGIPYLWGGNTPKGFDCSGLVQRIYRLHGLVLPRDSDMLSRFGPARGTRDLDELFPGDLLFFGRVPQKITHVGMVLPGRLFLHAYGQVRVNSLDPGHPLFEPSLASDWRGVHDPLGQAGYSVSNGVGTPLVSRFPRT
jgi:gamma-D-glutamyl-L-lysine dipeptidyl-peptidase